MIESSVTWSYVGNSEISKNFLTVQGITYTVVMTQMMFITNPASIMSDQNLHDF